MFFDTHAHYDDPAFDNDRAEVLAGLKDHQISLVMNPGSNVASSHAAIQLAETYDFIYAAVGVHPHEAKDIADHDLNTLETLAAHTKVKAIGEIGLDYYYDHSPRDIQQLRFRQQMALAEQLRLPVIIHDREAHGDCFQIVREFPQVIGVYHCYSGSLEMAKQLLDLGWYLSFNGAITFKNARKSLEVISYMPMDRLMLETDAPYLSPVPFRGKRNDSRRIPLVAEAVSAIRHMSLEEVARVTTENGKHFFRIP
ncbi:MAG: TatD family hydrolase [Oscillospiraceae bacterium]|nr:TatD family hydrolase [Oscillospiraceae bacterium]